MSHTQGKFTQDGAANDLQIFLGASAFVDTAGHAVFTVGGPGLASQNLASTLAGTLYATRMDLYKRTGEYATPAGSQEQFGTAASVPGPTAVANTSGPLAQKGYPPTIGTSMSTLAGPATEPIPKGIQIDSVDVIYAVGAVNAAAATMELTKTKFVNGVAPAVVDLIALGVNGLPVVAAAQPYVTNVKVTTPVMLTDSDSQIILNVNLTAGSGGTITFYGAVLHCSYNLN